MRYLRITTDYLLEAINNNRYKYDSQSQMLDVRLMCSYLRYKYNNDELKNVFQVLSNYIKLLGNNNMSHMLYANDIDNIFKVH